MIILQAKTSWIARLIVINYLSLSPLLIRYHSLIPPLFASPIATDIGMSAVSVMETTLQALKESYPRKKTKDWRTVGTPRFLPSPLTPTDSINFIMRMPPIFRARLSSLTIPPVPRITTVRIDYKCLRVVDDPLPLPRCYQDCKELDNVYHEIWHRAGREPLLTREETVADQKLVSRSSMSATIPWICLQRGTIQFQTSILLSGPIRLIVEPFPHRRTVSN